MKRLIFFIILLFASPTFCGGVGASFMGASIGGGGNVTYHYNGYGGYSATQNDASPASEVSRSNRTDSVSFTASENGTIDSMRVYIGASGMSGNWYLTLWTNDADDPEIKMCQTGTQSGGSSGWSAWITVNEVSSKSITASTKYHYSAYVASGYIGYEAATPNDQNYYVGEPGNSASWTNLTGANRAIQIRYIP